MGRHGVTSLGAMMQIFELLSVKIRHNVVRVYSSLRRRLLRFMTSAATLHEDVPVILTQPKKSRALRADSPNEVDSSRWHFKVNILDRLDEYFFCLSRLRRACPDDYELFRRIGLAMPADRWFSGRDEGWMSLNDIPSMGGCSFPKEGEEKTVVPSLMYFNELKSGRSGIEKFDGRIFKVTVVFDMRHSIYTLPVVYHVGLSASRQVSLLKENCLSVNDKRISKQTSVRFRTQEWGYPRLLVSVASDRRERGQPDCTPESFGAQVFKMMVCTHVSGSEKIIVRVTKGALAANFGIDVSRSKYFFADRDITLASDGKKKRIFHYVRRHARQLTADRETTVREHYRGLRKFMWNAYAVGIVLPSLSNVYLDSGLKGVYDDEIKESEKSSFADNSEVGDKIRELVTS